MNHSVRDVNSGSRPCWTSNDSGCHDSAYERQQAFPSGMQMGGLALEFRFRTAVMVITHDRLAHTLTPTIAMG